MLGRTRGVVVAGRNPRPAVSVSMVDPALVGRVAKERRPVGEEWMGEGRHCQHPAGEHERERGGFAPSLRMATLGWAHVLDRTKYGPA